MRIDIINEQKDLKISPPAIRRIVREVIRFEKRAFDEVGIHFITTQSICELHQEYFNDPSPTDCISFPLDDDMPGGYKMMGDIFICPQAAIDYAQEHSDEASRELTLYIVHGLLHLMGYDDMNECDEMEMRKAEKRHIKNLTAKNLIL